MRRSSFRLTGTSYAVLALLDHLGGATPYELKQAIETSVENFWPVPHTTFYAEPARLAQAGYLSVDQEHGGRRRKHYALTDAGRGALREWAAQPEAAPPQVRDEGLLKIFAGADPAPILAARRAWHREKIAELEGYLAAHDWDTADPQSLERTLMAGIAYHRHMLAAIDDDLVAG